MSGQHQQQQQELEFSPNSQDQISIHGNENDYLLDQSDDEQEVPQQEIVNSQLQPMQVDVSQPPPASIFNQQPQYQQQDQNQSQPQYQHHIPSTTTSSTNVQAPNFNTTSSFLPVVPTSYLSSSSLTPTFQNLNTSQVRPHSIPPTSTPTLSYSNQAPHPLASPVPCNPGILLRIFHLHYNVIGNAQLTPVATKYSPPDIPFRYLSNFFYETVKTTYVEEMKDLSPYRQMNQIGVRLELFDMTAAYLISREGPSEVYHNVSFPISPQDKANAPIPLVISNQEYGSHMEAKVYFQIRFHRPPPDSYVLTPHDRTMIRTLIDASRKPPKPQQQNQQVPQTQPPEILKRVGYQTPQYQQQQQQQRQQNNIQPIRQQRPQQQPPQQQQDANQQFAKPYPPRQGPNQTRGNRRSRWPYQRNPSASSSSTSGGFQ